MLSYDFQTLEESKSKLRKSCNFVIVERIQNFCLVYTNADKNCSILLLRSEFVYWTLLLFEMKCTMFVLKRDTDISFLHYYVKNVGQKNVHQREE